MNRDDLDVNKEIYKIENKQTQCKTSIFLIKLNVRQRKIILIEMKN